MNISLTIICAIAVLLAIATAFLGQDDVENGVIFPWQVIFSMRYRFPDHAWRILPADFCMDGRKFGW